VTPGSSGARRPRGRPPLPRDQQRRRLVDAAWRAFEARHYDKTSVADIVREAGMSSRSFYDHFASKEDLVAAIVEDYGARLLSELGEILREPAEDLADQSERSLRAFLELLPTVAIDLERIGGHAGRRVGEVRRLLVQAVVDLLLAHLERVYAQGRVSRAPSRPAVELLVTGVESLGLRYYGEGRRRELLALRPALLQAILRVLA
jgi:AcrR family transcriptional regulator